jgi:autotransporter-associated beta strand protein
MTPYAFPCLPFSQPKKNLIIMKTHFPRPLFSCLACAVMAVFTIPQAKADTLYWDGVNGNWSNVANWSTASDATTPNPGAAPGALDDTVFNITGADANSEVSLNSANRSAYSMTFVSSGTILFKRSSVDSTTSANSILLGAGGMTMAATSGAVTVGTNEQRINLRAQSSLSIANNSPSLLTLNRNLSSDEGSGTTVITFNGSGTGGTALPGSITDGAAAAVALVIDTTGGFTYLTGSTGNTYSGGTTLQQGVLALRSSNSFGSGPLTIHGGTFGSIVQTRIFSNNVTINGDFQLGRVAIPGFANAGTTFEGPIDLGGGTRTITLGNSATFTNTISNGGLTLESLGSYTLTLSGNSTYAGATHVNDGTLRINGDNSMATGAIRVEANATLGGNGSSGGAVTMAADSVLAARITDWTGPAGNGYEDLAVTSLSAEGALKVVLNTTGLTNFTEANQSFTILNTTGGISGFNPALASVEASGFTGLGTWALIQAGNSLVLQYTAGTADPYLAWIGGFEVSDTSKEGDPDHDGISNLMEFVLNGHPGVANTGILPAMGLSSTHFTFTYVRREDSKEVNQVVQYGTDLSGWTNVIIPDAAGESTAGAATVVVNDGVPASGPDTVTVSIPFTEAVGGKLFARLFVGP